MLYMLTQPVMIMMVLVYRRPSDFMTRYVGIRPPPKNMGSIMNVINALFHMRCLQSV